MSCTRVCCAHLYSLHAHQFGDIFNGDVANRNVRFKLNGQTAIVYIVPMIPSPAGGGVMMRSFRILQALTRQHRVHLVCTDVHGNQASTNVTPELTALCESIHCVRLPAFRQIYARTLRFLRSHFPCVLNLVQKKPLDIVVTGLVSKSMLGEAINGRYDKIVAFKLYTYPIAELFMAETPDARLYLDVDDIESVTRKRIAGSYLRNGYSCLARLLERESEFYGRMEKSIIPKAFRAFAASETDKRKLSLLTGATNVVTLPNVYPPGKQLNQKSGSGEYTFLFVGSFGYFPNHEAALMLCREIIPRVIEKSKKPVSFRFVGGAASNDLLKTIEATEGAEFRGQVSDMKIVYQDVDAVVVPINAGGGTRIKILEAFSFGVPVVTTEIGAEGIEAEHDTHLLLANTPSDFADQCLRLIGSENLSITLSRQARELLEDKYHPGLIDKWISS